MQEYLGERGNQDLIAPLFMRQDGKYLTRANVYTALTRSRAGGVSLAAAGYAREVMVTVFGTLESGALPEAAATLAPQGRRGHGSGVHGDG